MAEKVTNHSTRYFQLTSNVIMEYNYANVTYVANHQTGSENDGYILDLKNETTGNIVANGYISTNNLLIENYRDNYVMPINLSESKFIEYVSNDNNLNFTEKKISVTDNTSDIITDNFKLHFTSRNYLGDYDGFILYAYIYDSKKNKISLFSYILRKTDDLTINKDPMLINQKLYTTYSNEFLIPSVNALLNNSDIKAEKNLKNYISPTYSLLTNSPLVFSIYGVKSTYETNDYDSKEIYKVEKLNTIYIPIVDKFDRLSVNIEESSDGDYFKIYPVVGDGVGTSFSDYIYDVSNGRPDTYVILHELTLTEDYVDNQHKFHSDVTHKEHYIVNAASVDDKLVVNEEDLERVMIYRPVILHASRLIRFVIEDQMKIINTLDNTTIVKISSFDSSENKGCSPKKYGKNLSKIYLGSIPAQINVYNKKPEDDLDNLKLTNGGSNVTIENHQHSVIGFIECMNVGVSIEQIPVSSLNE